MKDIAKFMAWWWMFIAFLLIAIDPFVSYANPEEELVSVAKAITVVLFAIGFAILAREDNSK